MNDNDKNKDNKAYNILKLIYPWLWVIYLILAFIIFIQTIETNEYYLEKTNILFWLLTIVVAVLPNYLGFIKYFKSKKIINVFKTIPFALPILIVHAIVSFFLDKAYCGDDGVCGLGALAAIYISSIAILIVLFINLSIVFIHKKSIRVDKD